MGLKCPPCPEQAVPQPAGRQRSAVKQARQGLSLRQLQPRLRRGGRWEAGGRGGQAGAGDRDWCPRPCPGIRNDTGVTEVSRQLIHPRLVGSWTAEPAWARGVPRARAGSPPLQPPAQPHTPDWPESRSPGKTAVSPGSPAPSPPRPPLLPLSSQFLHRHHPVGAAGGGGTS